MHYGLIVSLLLLLLAVCELINLLLPVADVRCCCCCCWQHVAAL